MNGAGYLDTVGMWDATVRAPEQGLAAMAQAGDVLEGAALPPVDDVRSVVVLGSGTGATAAEFVSAHGAAHASIPVVAACQTLPRSEAISRTRRRSAAPSGLAV